MFPVLKVIVASLAVLSVGMAQSFGLCQGYLCQCTGEAAHSTASECHPSDAHGPAADCGEDHHCCPEEGGAPEAVLLVIAHGHECPPHVTFSTEMTAQTAPAGAHVPAPAFVAELPANLLDCKEFSWASPPAPVAPDDWIGSSPPTALLVARTMVRLV